MRVLVAFECSGVVRDAFKMKGHHAVSCDLKPTESPGLHYQGDALCVLDGWEPVQFAADCDADGDGWCQTTNIDPNNCRCIGPTQDGIEYAFDDNGILLGRPKRRPHWDLMIAHPPCTHLAISGAKHFDKKRADGRQQEGIDLFLAITKAPIDKICIENPVGIMSNVWRKPDQTIQPYYFGDKAQKTTHLWFKNLKPLKHVEKDDLLDVSTHVDKGEMLTFPSGKRMPKWYSEAKGSARSKTFQGFANAMAEQWG